MLFSKFLPVWFVLVFDVLLCGGASIGFIGADSVRDEIVRQEQKLDDNVKFMRELYARVEILINQCSDEEVRISVSKLAEDIKYSDVVSNDALKNIEDNLSSCIDDLKAAISVDNANEALSFCIKAESLLEERNALCKLNKK